MISQNKIQTIKKTHTSKVWYGNPHVELIEGSITYTRLNFNVDTIIERDYNENELESIKQYIWEINMKNDLIKTAELLCINVPNKISINEFLNTISIYLSYINILKNIEYANILYNTFNYAKVNPIEKEYFIFVEVKEIKFEELFFNELSYKNSKRLNGIKVLVSPSNKSSSGFENKIYKLDRAHDTEIKDSLDKQKSDNKFASYSEIFSDEIEIPNSSSYINNNITNNISSESSKEINLCPICLDQIEINNFSTNSLTTANGIIHVLCGHIFHIECSLKLDDDKCPMCRYNICPANVSSCSLCSCENDLWMCLICGRISCGEEGGSNNHRHEHYLSTGHIYAKGLGHTHNITFDFTKNASLNILLQNSFRNFNNTNGSDNFLNLNKNRNNTILGSNTSTSLDSLYFKDPKEKVQFIVSEYNSIISSQLENQRLYYLDYMRKLDDKYKKEEFTINSELNKTQKDLELLNQECSHWADKKSQMMESVRQKEIEVKRVENEFKITEIEYKELVSKKEKIEGDKKRRHNEMLQDIIQVDNEIDEISNQIKDLKIHINTLNKIGKKTNKNNNNNNDNNDISGATIEFISSTGNTGKIKKKSKNHRKK